MNTSGNGPKAAIYLRISSDPGNDELGVARQEKRGRQWCDDFGLEPVIFKDNDTSATSGVRRIMYEALIAAVEDGQYRAVWCWGHDRLCRDPGEFEVFMKIARNHGTLFANRDGVKNLSRAGDRRDARNSINNAAYEVENMKERQAEAFDQIAEAGRAWWAHRPFGYTLPRTEGRKRIPPELVPEEADAIRQAYHDVLAGRSLMAIAREWDEKGIRTAKREVLTDDLKNAKWAGGNKWQTPKIRELLLNPRNAALRERRRGEKVNGRRVEISREILDGVQCEWPAIVDPDIWRGAVAILKTRSRHPNAWVRKYLLSGLAICGNCGEKMVGSWHKSSKSKTSTQAYWCHSCWKVQRRMEKVDQLIIGLVVNYLADHKAVKRTFSGVDTGALRARLAELDGVEQELSEALGAGMKFALIKPQLDAVATERADINAKLDAQPHQMKPLENLLGTADIAEAFAAMKLDEKRAVIDTLFTITILPGQRSGRAPFDPTLVRVEPKL